MNKKNIFVILFSLSFLMISCEDDSPIDKEQYFKQVYIVGAVNDVMLFDVKYSDSPQQAYVSIATGGSQNSDKDVEVILDHNDPTIEWYNNKYMLEAFHAFIKYQKLDAAWYEIPSMSATISAGDVYTRLPFTVNTKDLECDSLYALTFKIKSASEYVKNTIDTVLLLNLNLTNDYSGVYQMKAIKAKVVIVNGVEELQAPSTANLQRTLKAVDEHTVRLFNEKIDELASYYETKGTYFNAIANHGVTFKVNADKTVDVGGWDLLDIVNQGECTYKDEAFTFSYDYMEGSTKYRLTGSLTK